MVVLEYHIEALCQWIAIDRKEFDYMSENRGGSRGRILRNGEIQMMYGKYHYKYKDLFGETRYVYSWRLDKNDRIPARRKMEPSLREKEKQIAADILISNALCVPPYVLQQDGSHTDESQNSSIYHGAQ